MILKNDDNIYIYNGNASAIDIYWADNIIDDHRAIGGALVSCLNLIFK